MQMCQSCCSYVNELQERCIDAEYVKSSAPDSDIEASCLIRREGKGNAILAYDIDLRPRTPPALLR
jgi:hypothetical protein